MVMDRVTAGGGVRWGAGGREGAVSAVEIVRSDQQ